MAGAILARRPDGSMLAEWMISVDCDGFRTLGACPARIPGSRPIRGVPPDKLGTARFGL